MVKIVNYAVFTCIIFMIIHLKRVRYLSQAHGLLSVYIFVRKENRSGGINPTVMEKIKRDIMEWQNGLLRITQ